MFVFRKEENKVLELEKTIRRLGIQVDDLVEERDDLVDSIQEINRDKRSAEILRKQVIELKEVHRIDTKRMKIDREMEEEKIRHLVSITKEKNEMELEKHKMEATRKAETKITEAHNKYRDKIEDRLGQEVSTMKDMYTEVLQRLPTVEALIEKSI